MKIATAVALAALVLAPLAAPAPVSAGEDDLQALLRALPGARTSLAEGIRQAGKAGGVMEHYYRPNRSDRS